MTDTIRATLYAPQQAYSTLRDTWSLVKAMLQAGNRMSLEVRPEKRSDAQNRRLWACLHDISDQVDWYGQRLTDAEWKDVFSAALKKQKVVPGLEGGFVVCGQSTSKMTKAEMSEMLELMTAFGVERGVAFRDGWDG